MSNSSWHFLHTLQQCQGRAESETVRSAHALRSQNHVPLLQLAPLYKRRWDICGVKMFERFSCFSNIKQRFLIKKSNFVTRKFEAINNRNYFPFTIYCYNWAQCHSSLALRYRPPLSRTFQDTDVIQQILAGKIQIYSVDFNSTERK